MTWSRPHKGPEQLCPHCGHHVNAATNTMGKRPPQTGDMMICIECGGAVEVLTDALQLRPIADADLAQVCDDAATYRDVRIAQASVRSLGRRPKGRPQ